MYNVQIVLLSGCNNTTVLCLFIFNNSCHTASLQLWHFVFGYEYKYSSLTCTWLLHCCWCCTCVGGSLWQSVQPCIAYIVCVCGWGGWITVPCALPDIYLEKLLSACAGVYIGTCIAKHITGCGWAVAYMYTCLLYLCVCVCVCVCVHQHMHC